jgi:hypothetical protein
VNKKTSAKTREETSEITTMEAPIYLNYSFTAGSATTRFLHGLKQGKLLGQSCPVCGKVYAPPRGSCAKCGVPTEGEVPLSDKASVESFTIVHLPIPGNPIKPPYIIANLVPDGSNISFIHLISECNNDDVHIGQRVQAVWKPESQWTYAMENISYFKPIEEADVDRENIGS